MIRHDLYLDSDQKPATERSGNDSKVIRCPYCGRILAHVAEVWGMSRLRLFCRSKECKLYFILDSVNMENPAAHTKENDGTHNAE